MKRKGSKFGSYCLLSDHFFIYWIVHCYENTLHDVCGTIFIFFSKFAPEFFPFWIEHSNNELIYAEVGRNGIGICYDIRFQELTMIYAARGLFPLILLTNMQTLNYHLSVVDDLSFSKPFY